MACPYFSFFNINLFLEILYMIIIHSSHTIPHRFYPSPILTNPLLPNILPPVYTFLTAQKIRVDNLDQEFHEESSLSTTFYLDSKSLDQIWICRDNLARLAYSCNGALTSEERKHRRKRNEYGRWHRIKMTGNGEEPSVCIKGRDPQAPSTIHLLLVHLLLNVIKTSFMSLLLREELRSSNHKEADGNSREEEVSNLKSALFLKL